MPFDDEEIRRRYEIEKDSFDVEIVININGGVKQLLDYILHLPKGEEDNLGTITVRERQLTDKKKATLKFIRNQRGHLILVVALRYSMSGKLVKTETRVRLT